MPDPLSPTVIEALRAALNECFDENRPSHQWPRILAYQLRAEGMVVVSADDLRASLHYGDWKQYMGTDVAEALAAALRRLEAVASDPPAVEKED